MKVWHTTIIETVGVTLITVAAYGWAGWEAASLVAGAALLAVSWSIERARR